MSILDQSADAGHALLDPISGLINPHAKKAPPVPSLRPDDFPDGFIITEYIGGIPQSKTSKFPPIQLVGNLMPMQPFPWEQEQRLIKEYYPGNNEAALQMLGIKYGDLHIKGRFKDKKFKDPGYYGLSYQIALALEQMQARGNIIRFGMEGSAGSWIRYGTLEKVDFKMNKLSWIDYELSFFVIGLEYPRNAFFSAPEKQIPSAAAQALDASLLAFENASAPPATIPRSLSEQMNALINDVAKNINLVTGFVQNILTTAQDIKSSAQRAIGLIQNLQHSFKNFQRQFSALTNSPSAYSTSGNKTNKMTDSYSNLQYVHETRNSVQGLSQQTNQLKAIIQKLAITIPISRYVVHKGDTLQQISIKFYNSSDNWTAIYDHNKLQSTILVEGTVLEIPRV